MPRVRATDVAREPIRKSPRMKMAKDWEDDTYDEALDAYDRLHIPQDIIKQIEQEDDVTLQWVTTSVRGQPEPQIRARFEKSGWRPVFPEDFGGIFDGHFTMKGTTSEIEVEGLTLMARPKEYSRKAEARDKRRAAEQVLIKEQSWRAGQMEAMGADHPSALGFNKINRSVERIEIPQDE